MDDLQRNPAYRQFSADPPVTAPFPETRPALRVTAAPEPDLVARAGRAMSRAGAWLCSMRVERGRPALEMLGGAFDSAGEYLQRRQFRGVRDDGERLIAARPVVSLLVAAVIGYAAARAIRS